MRPRGLTVFAALALCVSVSCRRAPARTSALDDDILRSPGAWLREEPVRLLKDYVQLDTTESRGEREGVEFLRRIFECEGIEFEILCPRPQRCNLLARLPGRHRGNGLLLLNHIDVAPVNPLAWTESHPFEGKIKGGYLYGRGAYDMKSLALAQALGMRDLKRRGIVPQYDILFLGEADEEIGQRWGSRWLLDNRPELLAGVRQVLNEGGVDETVLREVRFLGLETLQAGYGLAELETPKKTSLQELAARWPRLRSPVVEPDPQVVEGFDMLANHLVSPLTDPLRHLDRVRRNPQELTLLPDRYGSFLEARILWSPLYQTSPVPDSPFRGYVVISTPPGISPTPYLQEILEDARRHSEIRVVHSLSSGPTASSPYPTAFTTLLQTVTQARYPGVPFGPLPTFGGVTTSIYFRQRGIATYGYSPIPMNITDQARRHNADERIFLRDYLNGVALYSEVLTAIALDPPAQ